MDDEIRRRFRWVRLYQETGDAGLVCRRCGISYPTVRKWMRRFDESGEGGLVSRNRRPTQSPNRRIFARERALILDLRRNRELGAQRIQNELHRHHNFHFSLATIHKVLITSPVPQLVRPVRARRLIGIVVAFLETACSSTRVRLPPCVISIRRSMTGPATGSCRYSTGAPQPVHWPFGSASSKKCRFPCSGFKQIVAANSSR